MAVVTWTATVAALPPFLAAKSLLHWLWLAKKHQPEDCRRLDGGPTTPTWPQLPRPLSLLSPLQGMPLLDLVLPFRVTLSRRLPLVAVDAQCLVTPFPRHRLAPQTAFQTECSGSECKRWRSCNVPHRHSDLHSLSMPTVSLILQLIWSKSVTHQLHAHLATTHLHTFRPHTLIRFNKLINAMAHSYG